MSKFGLKLLGSGPFRVRSVSTILQRSADVCVYVGRDLELQIEARIQEIRSGSLEIVYLLAKAAVEGPFSQALLAANISAAFTTARLAADAAHPSAPLPGTAQSAMADVIDALENDAAIRGWSVKVGRMPRAHRTRDELIQLRNQLGGPKYIDLAHKVHIEIQQQFPGFPAPYWQIKWSENGSWQEATVAAPVDGDFDVGRFDKLVVDLEIHTLATKGAPSPREVFIKQVYWGESE